jgi:hypothetical protein
MAEDMYVPEAQSLVKSGGIFARSSKAQKSSVNRSVGNRPVAVILSGRELRRAQARKRINTNK